jgi:DNA-binding MurR/RpiR family transcriptional regulator
MLGQARMIHAFGMGGCSTLCSDELQVRWCASVTDCGVPRPGDDARHRRQPGAEHALIVCSLTGITPELLDVVNWRATTARAFSPSPGGFAAGAVGRCVAAAATGRNQFIYKPTAARYGMLLAIDLLATELALAMPDDNQKRLRRIKLALDDYRGGPDSLPLGD